MKKYLFIGAGGFFGAILRLWIKTMPIQNYTGIIPINTLFINITGSFILALISTMAIEIVHMDNDLRLGICTGFLGAYTTFSTMCKEGMVLLDNGSYVSFIYYITTSVFLGLGAAYLGAVLARKIVPKRIRKNKYN
ncbi:CrcB family protein [Clostridium sp. DJ247]|uniref:fluoride efflux transporter FluC n=1 Tax=Clostridium sp. DJ247 TaxID=2726188 RepID=UPI00162ACB15|nr:CrcB family protein [Clostridium sp. DJ247]MBC2581195.1 CrcB family protein [Clostridium sp. DJ247]